MAAIDYIQIYGERNSGTNYLHNLFEKNVSDIEVGPKYGWKHGFIRHEWLQQQDTSRVLFVALFKDPYSWFVSMNGKPHHAPQLYRLDFSDFIRREWASYKGLGYESRDIVANPLQPDEEMMHERDGKTGERFENVMQLRTAKALSFLGLKEYAENTHFMKYEDLLEDPYKQVAEVAKKFNLQLKPEFQVEQGHFGSSRKVPFKKRDYYLNKEYFLKYNQADLDYVNRFLDEEMERELGYEKVTNIENAGVVVPKPGHGSFIFTHIPKCGGTSFRKFIGKAAKNSGLVEKQIHIPGENQVPSNKNLPRLDKEELSALRERNLRVVAGHSKFDCNNTFELGMKIPFYYTILREPVARVISHYNHFCYKRGDHDCKGVPLEQLSEEKLADILRIFGNIQIRFIINESGRLLKRPNKKLVAKAMENLKNGYDCFGVLERLEESLNLLKHSAPSWLKLPEKFPFKNKNKTEAPPVPEWVIAKIREKNQCDVLLYEEALKLFDQMLDKR